jgi:hypothetical protein
MTMNRFSLLIATLSLVFFSCAPSANGISPSQGEVLYHSQNKPSNENRSSSFTQEVAVILIDYLNSNNVTGFERLKYQAGESLITHSYARLVFSARTASNPNAGTVRSVWTLRDRGDYYFSLSANSTSNLEIPAKLERLEAETFNYLSTIFERISGNR